MDESGKLAHEHSRTLIQAQPAAHEHRKASPCMLSQGFALLARLALHVIARLRPARYKAWPCYALGDTRGEVQGLDLPLGSTPYKAWPCYALGDTNGEVQGLGLPLGSTRYKAWCCYAVDDPGHADART